MKRYIMMRSPETSVKDFHSRLSSTIVRRLDLITHTSEQLRAADQLGAATYNSSTVHLLKSNSLLDIILRLKRD